MRDVSVELINHASALIQWEGGALLSDPWYQGTCFRDGWGLQFDNPAAYDRAATATYLWISHFHGDHLHFPTLKALAKKAPHLIVLANRSANYDMEPALREAGFSHFEALPERNAIDLGPQVTIERYPSGGIDNMLVMRFDDFSILNFNDCNLPIPALKSLMRRIGPIDALLLNYNIAEKLLEPYTGDHIRRLGKEWYRRKVEAVNPRWVIPFASTHYFRSEFTKGQNEGLLTPQELAEVDPRTLAIGIGDTLRFLPSGLVQVQTREPALPPTLRSTKVRSMAQSVGQILPLAEKFCRQLRETFYGLVFWLPPLRIFVNDWGNTLEIHAQKSCRVVASSRETADIAAHSSSILEWFGKPFGTDAFFVGGDFELCGPPKAIRRWMTAGLIFENGLSPRQAARLLTHRAGWRFFQNRREELSAHLRSFHFQIGTRA